MSDDNITTVTFTDINLDLDADDLMSDEDLYETDEWPAYLMWIQKTFASLSIICSYVICREILSDLKHHQSRRGAHRGDNNHNRGRSVQFQRSIGRILLNLNISDIIFSFAIVLGEWPAPTDTLYIHHAAGNQQFCTFQGWLRALGYLASPMFSLALNAFSLLLIKYRWQESDLFSLEKEVTFGIWAYALVLSIIPIPLEAYNSDFDVCWIVPSPLNCSDEECTRGLIANKLEIYYSFVHIWTCMFFSVVLMVLLFRTVKELEDRSKVHLPRGVPSSQTTNIEATGGRSATNSAVDHPASPTAKTSAIEELTSEAFTNNVDDDEPPQSNCESENESDSDSESGNKNKNGGEGPEGTIGTTKISHVSEVEAGNSNGDNKAQGRSVGQSIAHATDVIIAFFKRRVSVAFPTLQSRTHRMSRAVAYQGILYTLAFMSTHLFDMIASIIWRIDEIWHLYFDIAAYMVLQPSLGILNFLIFSRNRSNMATPEGKLLRKIVCCCDCFCGLCKRPN